MKIPVEQMQKPLLDVIQSNHDKILDMYRMGIDSSKIASILCIEPRAYRAMIRKIDGLVEEIVSAQTEYQIGVLQQRLETGKNDWRFHDKRLQELDPLTYSDYGIRLRADRLAQESAEQSEKADLKEISYIKKWLYAHENEPIVFIKGTTRSGKTYAIMQYLVEKYEATDNESNGFILAAALTVPMLKNGCAQYLQEICSKKGLVLGQQGMLLNDGHRRITLQSFDNPDKGLSAAWKIVFLNEGNLMNEHTVDHLRVRCKGQVIVDFNESKLDWWGASLMNESNTLNTSWRDNPYLSSMQIQQIEAIRTRGEHAPVGSYAHWYYQVYYLGNYHAIGGGVFDKLTFMDEVDYDKVEIREVGGLDFGDVSDPNVLVGVKVDKMNKRVYVKEYYRGTNIGDTELAARCKASGLSTIVFETGTAGKTRVGNMMRAEKGLRFIPAYKPSVMSSVFELSNYDIQVCPSGNAWKEFTSYKVNDGEFEGEGDHAIDAARYAWLAVVNGFVKV